MSIRLSDDYRYPLRGGGNFSSLEAGFLFIESNELAQKGEHEPPLQMHRHCEFISKVVQSQEGKCLWLAESPADAALRRLKERFPNHQVLDYSIAGYIDRTDQEAIASFWKIFSESYERESWNTEEPWALACVSHELPIPEAHTRLSSPQWAVEHCLRNHVHLNSIFAQMGWFASLGIRQSETARRMIASEFPTIVENAA